MPRRPKRNNDSPSVSAVIPTYNPDPSHLAWTLDALSEQTLPPEEVVIVDSSEKNVKANADAINTRVIDGGDMGMADARELGVQEATGEYIIDMDEDAVLVSDEYIEKAVAELQKPGVSAAGGVVYPIRGNAEGKIISALDKVNPTTLGTHTLVFPRWLCETEDGNACYPMPHRGEDVTLRRRLEKFGQISRMNDQSALKDLPTKRQETGRNTVLWTVAGGVLSGLLVSAFERQARNFGNDAVNRLRESFSGGEAGN